MPTAGPHPNRHPEGTRPIAMGEGLATPILGDSRDVAPSGSELGWSYRSSKVMVTSTATVVEPGSTGTADSAAAMPPPRAMG
ncbi:MAG: hypothetical protein K0S78_2082 [Thermomicrobiales bacterium]|nr:hypothetical protein [Thermomicrobiales bacterium]